MSWSNLSATSWCLVGVEVTISIIDHLDSVPDPIRYQVGRKSHINQQWYLVGKYISIEMVVEKSQETYYEVLQDSSIDWH